MYHDGSQANIIATQSEGEPIPSEETKNSFYFCLGWNDEATARGKPFTSAQIPGDVDDAFRLEIVRKLVSKGLLLPVPDSSVQEKKSAQGEAASYFQPEL